MIAVAQSKGGCGKTTITVCLAGHWATAGESVCVIDADATQQHAAKWLEAGGGVLKNVTLVCTPKDLSREIGRQAEAHERCL